MDTQNPIQPSAESLETNDPTPAGTSAPVAQAPSIADASSGGVALAPGETAQERQGGAKHERLKRLRRLLKRFNIYFLIFILVLVVIAIIMIVSYLSRSTPVTQTAKPQTVSSDTLKQLANSDVTVGQPKQVLNVQSNAVFAGKVLIQDSLEVAGPIQVGGPLSIPGITVSGRSVFDSVQINKDLAVGGNGSLQGQLSVQKNLSVAGGATFGGSISAPQLSVTTLQLNGDLNINRHITAGGATPGRSGGGALGGGGTVSLSGSDSAGSIAVNTGAGASSGCFVTVNFVTRFNATPHVLITPVGSGAAGIQYYVNRSTTNFSICSANALPSSASFGFDYFVLD